MKKTILALMILAVAAGVSFAQDEGQGEQNRKGKQAWGEKGMRGERGMNDEMRSEMRAMSQECKAMGQAIRDEADEAKKAELTADLRAKINEMMDARLEKQEERLAQAEGKLTQLKSRIEESKANRDQLVDEKVERILSGKGPKRGDTEAFRNHPNAKGGRGEGKGNRNRGQDQDEDDDDSEQDD